MKRRSDEVHKSRFTDYEGDTAFKFEELKALDSPVKIVISRDVPEIDLPHQTIGPFTVLEPEQTVPMWLAEYLHKNDFATIALEDLTTIESIKSYSERLDTLRNVDDNDDPTLELNIPQMPSDECFFIYRRAAAITQNKQLLSLLNQYQTKRKVRIDVLVDELSKKMTRKDVLSKLPLSKATTDEIIYLWGNIKSMWEEYSYLYDVVDLPRKVHAAAELVLSDSDFMSQNSQNSTFTGLYSETSETLHTANVSDLLGESSATNMFSLDD